MTSVSISQRLLYERGAVHLARSSTHASACARGSQTRHGALCDQFPLELGKGGEDAEHAAAVAEVSAAEQSVRLAETVRRQASVALATADDEARRAGYVLRLEALDAAMMEVLGQAAAVNRRLHRQPQYIGSHELRHTLSRLAIEFPVIAASLNPADPRRMAAQRAAAARQMAEQAGRPRSDVLDHNRGRRDRRGAQTSAGPPA
jgi:hypothetical protein